MPERLNNLERLLPLKFSIATSEDSPAAHLIDEQSVVGEIRMPQQRDAKLSRLHQDVHKDV